MSRIELEECAGEPTAPRIWIWYPASADPTHGARRVDYVPAALLKLADDVVEAARLDKFEDRPALLAAIAAYDAAMKPTEPARVQREILGSTEGPGRGL